MLSEPGIRTLATEPGNGLGGALNELRARWRPNVDAVLGVLDLLRGPEEGVEESEYISQVQAAIDYLERLEWPEGVTFEHVRGPNAKIDLRGADFSDSSTTGVQFKSALLDGARFMRSDLTRADFSQASLRAIDFSYARGEGATFAGSTIEHCQFSNSMLRGIDFSNSHVVFCSFLGSELRGCSLRGARVRKSDFGSINIEGGCLQEANFQDCRFSGANLAHSNLRQVVFVAGDLSAANMKNAELADALLEAVNLSEVDLRGAVVSSVRWRRLASVSRMHIAGASFANSRELERYIRDEQWLEEFREKAGDHFGLNFWKGVWWLTSDYGRSMKRLFAWVIILIAFFALLFHCLNYGGPFPPGPKLLTWPPPAEKAVESSISDKGLGPVLASFHLSIDLFTTLGVSRVEPRTPLAALVVWTEAFLGWLTMGSFLSVLANVFARRA